MKNNTIYKLMGIEIAGLSLAELICHRYNADQIYDLIVMIVLAGSALIAGIWYLFFKTKKG